MVALGCVLATALALWALGWLSRELTRLHLRQAAEHTLWVAEYGDPLWSWELREPRDLVAQKVFGHATLATTSEGLRVTSTDGTPFELGLPVRAPMDARHWPQLELILHASAPAKINVLWQPDRDAALCESTQAVPLDPDDPMLAVPLDEMGGVQANGSTCPPPTTIAWLLRVRITAPPGTSIDLRRAALVARLPMRASSETVSADSLDATALQQLPPLTRISLPQPLNSNDWLSWRDRLRRAAPSAIISVEGDHLEASPDEPPALHLPWLACAAYLMLLGWVAWKPKPPLELPAILLGLLWLIGGLQWGLSFSRPAAVAFSAAVVFAGWRNWRTRPHDWAWLGRSWSAWLAPLALVPVAALLAWWLGQGWSAPLARHAITYLGWAALQQWLMLAVVLPRFEACRLPRPAAWLATALVFALLHTPNGTVMQLCLLAELWWAACFLRWRCLLPIALAHAAGALIVEASLTGTLVRSLEVSARFFL